MTASEIRKPLIKWANPKSMSQDAVADNTGNVATVLVEIAAQLAELNANLKRLGNLADTSG